MTAHITDPLGFALDHDADREDHVSACPSCAARVREADRFVRNLRDAASPIPSAHLPEAAAVRRMAHRRRRARTVRRFLAAASVLLALAGVSRGVQQERRASAELRDDALLRSIQGYQKAPDIGGLGTLVDLGLEADGRG